MTVISTTWTKVKEVYVGNDGYHNVYWRMYARIGSQSGSSTTVQVLGKLYLSGSAGSLTCGSTTTVGGSVGNYQAWGIGAEGTYYPGETELWYGADTTTGSSIFAAVRFYSSPWGWTGDNLALSDTLTFQAPTPPTPTPTVLEKCHDYDFYGSESDVSARVLKLYGSLNDETKEITKLYGSVYGVTRRIF